MMFENRLCGHLEMLSVIHLNAEILLNQLNEHAKLSMLINSTWTLSIILSGDKSRNPVLPALKRLINSTDEEVLTDVCWAVSYLTIQMTKFKLLLQLVPVADLLIYRCRYHFIVLCFFSSHPSPTVLIPALRTVGNIITRDDRQTQVGDIIDYGMYIIYHIYSKAMSWMLVPTNEIELILDVYPVPLQFAGKSGYHAPLAGRTSNFILKRDYISGNTSKLPGRPICK
ncbi:importin subunit alpha-2-like isoform X1 [Papaver somniferum]|uniref:importin subunit alpha-2-like isoform X1 n=1 Tax=Papaver somniferum TaxID=3469 RepID=UPI000E6FB8B8|nr:importin subunit alpha-2-like isoform X1 [Papaver somniferum]XP_026454813.1 importin subunit alpha-2-like isoform X1 [Papaver somniferum]